MAAVDIARPVGYRKGARAAAATTAAYIALGVTVILFLIPFYLLVRNALATDAEITAPGWTVFPKSLHWENITELFSDPAVPFVHSLLNSGLVAVLHTTGTLVICSLAGYGLARIPYRHADRVFYTIMLTLMIPGAVTFVPSFVIVSNLGWISDLRGLIIPGLFS